MYMFKKLFCKHDFTIFNVCRIHGGSLNFSGYGDYTWIRSNIYVICEKCEKGKSFYSQKIKVPVHNDIYTSFCDSIKKEYYWRHQKLLLKLKKKYSINT